jgi:hypothetical protein
MLAVHQNALLLCQAVMDPRIMAFLYQFPQFLLILQRFPLVQFIRLDASKSESNKILEISI